MLTRVMSSCRILVAACLAGIAVLAAHPALARGLGLDVWAVPELRRTIEQAAESDRQLDAEVGRIRQRTVVKEMLIAELIAGRTTLAEVTAQFQALHERHQDYLELVRIHYPGETDREKVARNVIDYTLPRVPDSTRRGETRNRLEAELARMTASADQAAAH